MDNTEAIAAFAALAQTTRLDTFRLLVKKEPDGVPAGELARLMAVPQNTMSAHLAILARAGLVSADQRFLSGGHPKGKVNPFALKTIHSATTRRAKPVPHGRDNR